jgi:hypothetical protein
MIGLLIQERNKPKRIESHSDIVQEFHFRQFLQLVKTREAHVDTTGTLQLPEDMVSLTDEPFPAKSSAIFPYPEAESVRSRFAVHACANLEAVRD